MTYREIKHRIPSKPDITIVLLTDHTYRYESSDKRCLINFNNTGIDLNVRDMMRSELWLERETSIINHRKKEIDFYLYVLRTLAVIIFSERLSGNKLEYRLRFGIRYLTSWLHVDAQQ